MWTHINKRAESGQRKGQKRNKRKSIKNKSKESSFYENKRDITTENLITHDKEWESAAVSEE